MNKSLLIIVPCYNESERLPKSQYLGFLQQQNDVMIVFADDGSTDNTVQILNEIKSAALDKVHIYSLQKNSGKAHAIREATLFCFENNFKFDRIAYLDADLATSLEECLLISNKITENTVFAFGSRISKIDNNIQRKFYRHIIGRFIATIISNQLGLSVYDTQCGCKVFDAKLGKQIFQEAFISKWLFDVEIFHRLIHTYGKDKIAEIAVEVPLQNWVDVGDSKVSFSYFFKIWFDIILIRKKYK